MAESWANKYRPETISDYIGDTIKETILTRFSTGREEDKPKLILLKGTRGCGKTSMANLIAKEFNCVDKQNNLACGKCEICQEMNETLIHAETGVDTQGAVLVDIASDRGVGFIDELLEEALLEPMHPYKYKVYIFDEFHMATDAAQNRLLKIFEDVPSHLVFILCTTDPEKIKQTILSRCQMNLEVKKPTEEQMLQRLLFICEKEKVKVSHEALKLIIKKRDRVPRECILLLEEVAKGFGFQVTVDNLKTYFSEVGSEVYCKYFKAANKSMWDILDFTHGLKEKGIEYKDFLNGILKFALDASYIQRGINLSEYSQEYVKQTQEVFKNYSSDEMEIVFEILENSLRYNFNNSTQAEFIVINMAMRLGRAVTTYIELKNLAAETKNENEAAFAKYKKLLDEEKEGKIGNIKSKALQGITGIVGLNTNQIKEITAGFVVSGSEERTTDVIPKELLGKGRAEEKGTNQFTAEELLMMMQSK